MTSRSRAVGTPTVAGRGTDTLPLKVGSQGPNVHQVQRDLQARGQSLLADGVYGTVTASAVTSYEKTHSLAVDGCVSAGDWVSLFPTLRQGSTQHEAVRALKSVLRNAWGYSSITVDGKFGAATTATVKNFQSRHYLTADGVVGQATWKALFA